MDHEDDRFHHDESADVYLLYNACNGALSEGKLDITKLGELSHEEREFLNVPKLLELWDHIDSGCVACSEIIDKLTFARTAMRAVAKARQRGFGASTAASAEYGDTAASAEYAESASQTPKRIGRG